MTDKRQTKTNRRGLKSVPGCGKPGPKKEPKEMKDARGARNRPGRGDKLTIQLTKSPSKMPPGLPQKAKNEWRRLAPIVRPLGLLTAADTGPFALMCIWWAMIEDAVKELKGGIYGKGTHKTTKPAFVALRQASAEYLKLADRFGLTPVARQHLEGIIVPPSGGAKDDNDEDEGQDPGTPQGGGAGITDRNGKPI